MARAGDTLTIRGTGSQVEKERLIFRQTAAETGGALLEIEAHYAPGGH
jgi:acyl-CoA thioesterase FadM